jgi:hypothetical protein
MTRAALSITAAVFLTWTLLAQDPPVLLKQEREGAPATNLSGAERATLGDPFFELVLKARADAATTLSAIENLLQPDAAERQTFVVDENIADPRQGQQRRAVLAYTASNGPHVLTTNVMLSVAFSSAEFPDRMRFIEAWGWDNARGRYNYYKLDRSGTPDQRMTWKFRGSSIDADLLTAGDREGTCMQCHLNGAPIMKELFFPWNNWHSFASTTTYLTRAAAPPLRWPVASDPRLGDRLKGAETLETDAILPSITQFNTRRLNLQIKRRDADGETELDASGAATLLDARRLLAHLFDTTEVNLISSSKKSGMHPLSPSQSGPTGDIPVPASFFLNANLMASRALGIDRAKEFAKLTIPAAEYARVVKSAGLELAGRTPADADFAWFTPEPSHIDNDMVERLMLRGVLTPQFVAAVLAVDLEEPILSSARARLLAFVPDTIKFRPIPQGPAPDFAAMRGAHAGNTTVQAVIKAVETSKPSPGSPEADFLAVLRSANPIDVLAQRVDAYHKRVQSALAGPEKQKEIDRLFKRLVDRRVLVLQSERFGPLDETGDRLLPVPPLQRPIRGSGGQTGPGQ